MSTALQLTTEEGRQTRRREVSRRVRVHDGSRSRASRRPPRSATRAANAAIVQERARIARELHDSVLQTLYAVTLTASRALRLLPQRQAIGLETSLEDILRLADAGQCELRTLLMQIRADSRAPGGLTDGLTNLAAEVRTQNDLDIRLSLPDEPTLPAATKAALLSISREALHNVVKHAAATRVDIVLERDAGQLVLRIIDDGRGFDPRTSRPGHFGLQSMRERAAAVGGTLAYISAGGAGTQVRVRLPRATGRDG